MFAGPRRSDPSCAHIPVFVLHCHTTRLKFAQNKNVTGKYKITWGRASNHSQGAAVYSQWPHSERQ